LYDTIENMLGRCIELTASPILGLGDVGDQCVEDAMKMFAMLTSHIAKLGVTISPFLLMWVSVPVRNIL